MGVNVGPGQSGGEQGPEVRRRDPLEDLREADLGDEDRRDAALDGLPHELFVLEEGRVADRVLDAVDLLADQVGQDGAGNALPGVLLP